MAAAFAYGYSRAPRVGVPPCKGDTEFVPRAGPLVLAQQKQHQGRSKGWLVFLWGWGENDSCRPHSALRDAKGLQGGSSACHHPVSPPCVTTSQPPPAEKPEVQDVGRVTKGTKLLLCVSGIPSLGDASPPLPVLSHFHLSSCCWKWSECPSATAKPLCTFPPPSPEPPRDKRNGSTYIIPTLAFL